MKHPILHLGLIAVLGAGLAAQDKPHKPTKPLDVRASRKLPAGDTVAHGDAAKGRIEQKPAAGQPGEASGGDSWFDVTNRDLGTFYGKGEAVGTFRFKNPHDEPIDWRSLTPSCQCAKAVIRVDGKTFRLMNKPKRLVEVIEERGQPERIQNVAAITIPAGAEGEVETHLDMRNIQGAKYATLDIHSTDPKQPQSKLTFRAKGAKLFALSPNEVNLNKMSWNDQREFTVTVSSPLQKDWQILSMDEADKAFDVTWEKSQVGDRTQWTIKGKYGPLENGQPGGGVLRFKTDVNGASTFDVRVLAYVTGPLDVKPGAFLPLGLIRKGSAVSKEVVFEPNDGTELEALSIELGKLTLKEEFVTAVARKDGKNLVIDLTISADAPKGLVKGEMVVTLNHPLVKEKRVMFNGFVR